MRTVEEFINYFNEMITDGRRNRDLNTKAYITYKCVPNINKFIVMLFEIKDDNVNKEKVVKFTLEYEQQGVFNYLPDLGARDLGYILDCLYELDKQVN